MSKGSFYELQLKIIDIYIEGLISNDELEQLVALNRFINIESKRKKPIAVNSYKVIKSEKFPVVENSKFWKATQDLLEKKRMAAIG